MLKKGDIIIIVVLLIISLTSIFIVNKDNSLAQTVVISVDNKPKVSYSLYENRTVEIKNNGYNKIVIYNGYVYIESANCKDKICVNHKKISKKGETIICLPNKVVLEIK